MFHPVGSLPPSVYWRRRVALLASVVVLLVLTIWVLRPGNGGGSPAAAGTTPTTPHVSIGSSSSASSSMATTTSAATASDSRTTTKTSTHAATSGSAAPKPCALAALKLAAVVEKPTYSVGDQPVLMLQVTNPGTTPCVQDLADQQIELRVYNGESRVWGSHDCQVQPGTSDSTLLAGQSVRVSITWSGLSSQPKCAGTRQRVGAGTYTLYASLSGREAASTQFAIS